MLLNKKHFSSGKAGIASLKNLKQDFERHLSSAANPHYLLENAVNFPAVQKILFFGTKI